MLGPPLYPINSAVGAISFLVAVTGLIAVYVQRVVGQRPPGRRRIFLALPILGAHAVLPACFSSTHSETFPVQLLTAAMCTWWGSVKVMAYATGDAGD